MNYHVPTDLPADSPRLRSGTAARLAGLPVTTLRVWERRYNVVAASKTDGGQRLYSGYDVSRLKLLRSLSAAGHAIGSIAALGLESLQALAAGVAMSASHASGASRRTVVVGRSAARRMASVEGCVLGAVFDDLDQAEADPARVGDAGVDLLLVQMASLQPAAVQRVLALGTALRAGSIVVVYAFGTEASTSALRAAGAVVRRGPVTQRELAQLIRGGAEAPAAADAGWPVVPRRYSDEALAELAEMPSPVACECLRHLSEIVTQLAGFERYSQDCSSASPADAALHRHLNGMAGAARTMFEQALQRVVASERLPVPEAAPGGQSRRR